MSNPPPPLILDKLEYVFRGVRGAASVSSPLFTTIRDVFQQKKTENAMTLERRVYYGGLSRRSIRNCSV